MITEFQPLKTDGLTHASSVMPAVRSRSLASATVTQSLTPSKDNAAPFLPAVDQEAPEMVPVCALPDASAVDVPVPSSKAYAAISPAGGGGTTLETVTLTAVAVV